MLSFRPLFLAGLLFMTSGCVSVGQASQDTYNWGGETFPENPASIIPYFVGLGLGSLASSPLYLLSVPATWLAYPESGDDEDRLWSHLSPMGFVGTSVGCVFAAPFYPFGWPFMDGEGEDGWDDEWDGEPDGRDFDEGPPGGEDHPIPPPWTKESSELPTRDGVPAAPFRRSVLLPWEDYRPESQD